MTYTVRDHPQVTRNRAAAREAREAAAADRRAAAERGEVRSQERGDPGATR